MPSHPLPGRRSADRSTTRAPASRARATQSFEAPCGSALNTSSASRERRVSVADEASTVCRPTRTVAPRCSFAVANASASSDVEDECAELATGVAAGPEHSDWNFIHPECIIMHTAESMPFVTRRCRACAERAILSPVDREPSMKKPERQEAILQLIGSHAIASQEELRRLLAERGWNVTQATLSRDLRDLGVVRAPTDDGARYMLPERLGGDEDKPSLEGLLPQLFDAWTAWAS